MLSNSPPDSVPARAGTVSRCSCGSTPKLFEFDSKGVPTIQLRCQCGNHGATVYYTKPEQRAITLQSVIDGWSLSH